MTDKLVLGRIEQLGEFQELVSLHRPVRHVRIRLSNRGAVKEISATGDYSEIGSLLAEFVGWTIERVEIDPAK